MAKPTDNSPGPGHNGGDLDRDLFLYHHGQMERIRRKKELVNAEAAKVRKKANADGVVLKNYKEAVKIADLAPEHSTEEMQRTKQYLQFLRQPLGSQITIEQYVLKKPSDQDVANTAYQEGRDAGIMGMSLKDNPYDGDPGDAASQSWLDGLGDGAKIRTQIEKGGYGEEQKVAA